MATFAAKRSPAGGGLEAPSAAVMTYALVGNPNCGKTTLFNALTGLRQKVGNYPGVTVEKKEGEFIGQHGERIKLIDLPGAYSLNARSPDEAVTRDILLGRFRMVGRPDRVVCVVDASNLERNLYLATQVLELGLPAIVVLNMMDVAREKGLRLDVERLEEILGIPVIPMEAHMRKGLLELRLAMSRPDLVGASHTVNFPSELMAALHQGQQELRQAGILQEKQSLLEALYLLSDHDPTHYGIGGEEWRRIRQSREDLEQLHPHWEDHLVSARYDSIYEIAKRVVTRPDADRPTLTDRLDAVLLHRYWGWGVLIGLMSLLFFAIFSLADRPMGWIESFFDGVALLVRGGMAPGDLRDLITDGVIAGVGGVAVFLPQILILFFFIGLMEDTGYMARIAFIMDRLMGKVGLNGKSFLPLLSSYACAVPGIMAARTIDGSKDRLITILVSPLASCSARLPVYLLMISTIVPSEHVPVVTKVFFMLLMYFSGTLAAFGFAWLFNRKLMPGESSPMILELPSYKAPSLKAVLMHMWERTRIFIRRAGTIILGISILLWFAAAYPKSDSSDPSEQLQHSFAGRIGQAIEPAIKPLGYDWKIGIGLLASFAAREVFVSTMSIIYSVEEDDASLTPLRDRLLQEERPDGGPLYTPALCLSLMMFYVFALQCMSTLAVVRRETNSWKWPLFQFSYMGITAYVVALAVYQVGSAMGY